MRGQHMGIWNRERSLRHGPFVHTTGGLEIRLDSGAIVPVRQKAYDTAEDRYYVAYPLQYQLADTLRPLGSET